MSSKEYQRALYKWCKERRICVKCNCNKAFQNHSLCAECIEKVNLRAASSYEANRDRVRNQRAENRQRRKEEGVCVSCGCRPADEGGTLCGVCKLKRRQYNRKHKVYAVKGENECFYCGKPVKQGFKVCPAHYDMCCKNMAKARGAVDKQNHVWRKDEDAHAKRWKYFHGKND